MLSKVLLEVTTLFTAACFVQIGDKATVSCSLDPKCFFILALHANQGDNCGPKRDKAANRIHVLSLGSMDLKIVHIMQYLILS